MGWQDDVVTGGDRPRPGPGAPGAPGAPTRDAAGGLGRAIGEKAFDAGQGIASFLQFLDPAAAAGAVLARKAGIGPAPKATIGDTWRQEMEAIRADRKQSSERSPYLFAAGSAAPAAALALVPGGAAAVPYLAPFSSSAAGTAGMAGKALQAGAGVADAALFNTVSALGSNADRPDALERGAAAATSPWNLAGGVVPALSLAKDVAKGAVPLSFREWLAQRAAERAPIDAFKAAAKGRANSTMGKLDEERPGRASEVGQFILDENLLPSNTTQPDDIFHAARANKRVVDNEINDLAAKASEKPEGRISLTDFVRKDARPVARGVADDEFQDAAASEVSRRIGKVAGKYAPRKELATDLDAVAQKHPEALELGLGDDLAALSKTFTPGYTDLGKELRKLARANSRVAELDPAEAQALQQDLEAVAAKYADVTIDAATALKLRRRFDRYTRGNRRDQNPDRNVAADELDAVRGGLNRRLGEAMDAAGAGKEWTEANRRSGLYSDTVKAAKAGRRDVANRTLGFSEQVAGLTAGGPVGAAVGLGLGGVAGAGIGAPLGSAAGAATQHAIRKYGAATAARFLDHLADTVAKQPEVFGKFAPAMQRVLTERGAEGVAAVHALLMKSNPEYRLSVAPALSAAQDEEAPK